MKINIIYTGKEEFTGKKVSGQLQDKNTIYRQYKVIRDTIPGRRISWNTSVLLDGNSVKERVWIQEGLDFVEFCV